MADSNNLAKNEAYEIKYYYSQALTALIITITHCIFGPISIPILWMFVGKARMSNMCYEFSLDYLLFEFLQWLWVASSLLIIFLTDYFEHLVFSMAGFLVGFSLRNLFAAFKYGYYTQKKWKKLSQKGFSTKKRREDYLIVTWAMLSRKVAEKQLIISFKRLFPNQVFYLKRSSDPSVEISMIDEAREIIETAVSKRAIPYFIISFLFAFLYSFIPLFIIDYIHGSLNVLDGIEWVYLIFTIFMTTMTSSAFCMFMCISIVDLSRKKAFQEHCTRMLTEKYLHLKDKNTIVAWYCIRSALFDFGKRISLRISLYISIVIPLCVGVFVIVLLMLVNVVDKKYIYYLFSPMCFAIVLLAILSITVSFAVSVNKSFDFQRGILLNVIQTYVDRPCSALSVLWVVVEKIEEDKVLRSITVMGFNVSSAFFAKLATTSISALIILLNVLF